MSGRSFYIALSVLLVAFGCVISLSSRGTPVVTNTNLERLPMSINGYSGVEDHFPASVYQELNADKHVYRHYRSPRGENVSLYIGYYGTAKGGRTGHNPYACLPGAGWGIVQAHPVCIAPPEYCASGKDTNVNFILAQKGAMYEVVLHWYQTDGNMILLNGIQQNVHRFLGRVLHNRNDGAFVRVSAVAREKDIASTEMRLKAFAKNILDLLPDYWPEENDPE